MFNVTANGNRATLQVLEDPCDVSPQARAQCWAQVGASVFRRENDVCTQDMQGLRHTFPGICIALTGQRVFWNGTEGVALGYGVGAFQAVAWSCGPLVLKM